MLNNRRLVSSAGTLTVALLLLSTTTFAHVNNPCKALERLLEGGWPEGSQHTPAEVRAIIESSESDRCGDLVSTTMSLEQEPFPIERKGFQMVQADEIDIEALNGSNVYRVLNYGTTDEITEYIGEITSLGISLEGQLEKVAIVTDHPLNLGGQTIIVDIDKLAVLREEGGEELQVYLDSALELFEHTQVYQAAPSPESGAGRGPPPTNLVAVRASRAFVALDDSYRTDFAGFGIVAFRRAPGGSLSERARHLCHGFVIGFRPVSVLMESGTMPDQQVVTAWPIDAAGKASELNNGAMRALDGDEVCDDAVSHYDWKEGDDAISDAAEFFRARGKHEIAERIASPDQDGPWLLAWAPGAEKGSTDDDVLVLAFDLSHVATQAQAERVFQAWRVSIEKNPELWTTANITNESWNSAIIKWANIFGRDLGFYNLMRQ